MSQWGRPRHAGTQHNRRVRGSGTWTEQDQRLSRHQLGRLHGKKGHPNTWTSQVRRVERPRRSRTDRYITGILIVGVAVIALSVGRMGLAVLVVAALLAIAWGRARTRQR